MPLRRDPPEEVKEVVETVTIYLTTPLSYMSMLTSGDRNSRYCNAQMKNIVAMIRDGFVPILHCGDNVVWQGTICVVTGWTREQALADFYRLTAAYTEKEV